MVRIREAGDREKVSELFGRLAKNVSFLFR